MRFSSLSRLPAGAWLWPALGALLLLAAAGSRAVAAGRTLYVAANGSDQGDGSAARPFRQIRRALAVSAAGDTILVGDGTYLGFDVEDVHGAPGLPITVRAAGASAVVVPTTDREDNRDTIFVTYSSYIVLEGLRSFNASRAAVRVDSSPHVAVRNGTFGNNGTWGIFTDFSPDLLLENNECFGSGREHGIYVSNSADRPVLRGNRCHDNTSCGIQLNADASMGDDGLITGALIENNILWNNGTGGGSAINLDGVQDSTVRNNLLFNNHASGILDYQADGAAGPRGMRFLNNTVIQAPDGRWAMQLGNSTGPNFIRNNILYNGLTYRGGLKFEDAVDVGYADSDYNMVDRITPDGDSTVYTLAEWQRLGHEPHSRSVPFASLFVAPGARDFHLAAGSPARDAAQVLPDVPRDLEGRARPAGPAPDLGCYEAPAPAFALAVAPARVTGGASATGTVSLPAPAPAGGVTVALAASSTVATVPLSVRVAAGASTATFGIHTRPVPSGVSVRITGTWNGLARWATLLVVTPMPASLALSPSSVVGGAACTGRVTLTGPAPAGGAAVALASSDPASAAVPSSVTVPAGMTAGSFTVTTARTALQKSARITASRAGLSRSVLLTLLPR